MLHYFEQFLAVYFWVFLFVTTTQTIYNVYLKSKGLKFKDQDFLSTTISAALFVMSIIYKFF